MYGFVNNFYAYHFTGISSNKDGEEKESDDEIDVLIENGGNSNEEDGKEGEKTEKHAKKTEVEEKIIFEDEIPVIYIIED